MARAAGIGAVLLALLLLADAARAGVFVTPWMPMFKGVDRLVGTNTPPTIYTNNGVVYTNSALQVVNCVRVDLHDPDVQFFATPRATNYVADTSETYSMSVSNFVRNYGVQVASVANFYETFNGSAWTADPNFDWLPSRAYGLLISTGQVVSTPDYGPDSNNRWASLLFTTNKTPMLALGNGPPGTNTAGIYTAVSGYYAVVTNGVIPGNDYLTATYPDPTFHQLHPRTVFGLSADRRYFYMMIIDGRQGTAQNVNPPYSDGADDNGMGFWMLQVGAVDGIAMDGGGSAAMYMENCTGGNPLPLGKSSYISIRGRERITGAHLGVRALPLPTFVHDEEVVTGTTSATISWQTTAPASSQVEYGLTPALGTLTPFDPTPLTNHTIVINGLTPGQRYYFRALSIAESVAYSSQCSAIPFATTNFASGALLPLNTSWRFTTSNLNGVNWTAPGYGDSGWANGVAPLWAHRDAAPSANYTNFVPNFASGTRMPSDPSLNNYPFMTYYFRKPFVYDNGLEGLTLTFSNFLDDGAVFYLNGVEIFRTNMPAGPIANDTPAAVLVGCDLPGTSFDNNATCPLMFTLSGDALSNLVVGTNYYAVEVHNFRQGFTPSSDVVFQSAVHFTLPPPALLPPFFSNVVIAPGETNAVFTWTTLSNTTAQILYGTTPLLGTESELDENLTMHHALVVTGLQAVTPYFFRLVATTGTNEYIYDGTFSTVPFVGPLVTSSNNWRFTTNNVSAQAWTSPGYDDSGWMGEGPALLHIENNVGVTPRLTPLPGTPGGSPMPTYYFRTHFQHAGGTEGFAMVFSNFIDDGAVFYLNGHEVQRVRMAPGPVGYTTFADGCPVNACEATEDVPDIFRLSGEALTNLVSGDNVFAVEVHQVNAGSSDVVFGSTVSLVRALASETTLRISQSNGVICVSWPGTGLTLQQTNVVSAGPWPDVPGPVTASPYCLTNPGSTTFFRLRN